MLATQVCPSLRGDVQGSLDGLRRAIAAYSEHDGRTRAAVVLQARFVAKLLRPAFGGGDRPLPEAAGMQRDWLQLRLDRCLARLTESYETGAADLGRRALAVLLAGYEAQLWLYVELGIGPRPDGPLAGVD